MFMQRISLWSEGQFKRVTEVCREQRCLVGKPILRGGGWENRTGPGKRAGVPGCSGVGLCPVLEEPCFLSRRW